MIVKKKFKVYRGNDLFIVRAKGKNSACHAFCGVRKRKAIEKGLIDKIEVDCAHE